MAPRVVGMAAGSSGQVKASVERLVGELRDREARILDYVRPGLAPTEIREIVGDIYPLALGLVDEAIEAWWSWHDGIDMSLPRPGSAEHYTAIHNVSPGTLMINPLEQLLSTYVQHLDGYIPPRDTFPLNYDDGGSIISLCRPYPNADWEVWSYDNGQDDWRPLPCREGVPTPQFDGYLDGIVSAIRAGKLQLDRGGVYLPTDPDREDAEAYDYPWM